MTNKGFAIAIDGPVGVGKSTTARLVAQKLSFTYIDTGAMYRSVALYQAENGLDMHDSASLEKSLKKINIKICNVEGFQKIFLNERDVTELIRTQEISEGSSVVAHNLAVREKLVAQQREMASAGRVVMDGRDIGSHVLPWAQLKIYLDANLNTRVKRRMSELESKGLPVDFEKIREETIIRDERDKNREHHPLIRTEDAILLDTGSMTPEETADAIIKLVSEVENVL
ncbi:MAG: (d)CMP kinase [Clostridiales bacterium]|jgi:cytidylate kinase|nr:(d)CMP kinase [Clostridiales bacterium]